MKMLLKIMLIAIAVLLIGWEIMFGVDFYQSCNLKEPVFAVETEISGEEEIRIYKGIGYKIKVEKDNQTNSVLSVTMYVLGKVVAASIQ